MASMKYGFLVGITTVVLMRIVPQPIGAMIYWTLLAIQATSFAIICWRRTRLPFATAAMVCGALVASSVLVLSAIGHPFPDLPRESWVPLGAVTALAPTLLWIESRVHPVIWRLLKQRRGEPKVWEMLIGRQIPRLRQGS